MWAGHCQREMQTLSATDAFRALIAEVIASSSAASAMAMPWLCTG